jgi:hypothetical protein
MGGFDIDHKRRARCPRCKHEVRLLRGYCRACGYSRPSDFSLGSYSEFRLIYVFHACGIIAFGVPLAVTRYPWLLAPVSIVVPLCFKASRRRLVWFVRSTFGLLLAPIRAVAALEWYHALPKWAQPIVGVLGFAFVPLLIIARPIGLVVSTLLLMMVLWGTRRPGGQDTKKPKPAEADHPMADPIDRLSTG